MALKSGLVSPCPGYFVRKRGYTCNKKNNRGKDLAKAVVGLVGRISEKIISLALIPYVPLNAVLRFHTKLFHFNVVIFLFKFVCFKGSCSTGMLYSSCF